MQACAKYSLERMGHIRYVENKGRPLPSYQKRMKPQLLRTVRSVDLSAKEIMCCSIATD